MFGLVMWLTDWLTDWLADWLTDWLADWLTDWLTDWLDRWLIDNEEKYLVRPRMGAWMDKHIKVRNLEDKWRIIRSRRLFNTSVRTREWMSEWVTGWTDGWVRMKKRSWWEYEWVCEWINRSKFVIWRINGGLYGLEGLLISRWELVSLLYRISQKQLRQLRRH